MPLDKDQIRHDMKSKRLQLPEQTLDFYNQSIFHKVIHHSQYQKAQTIGLYVSLPDEVQTFSIIEDALSHHRVCVPKVEGETMSFYQISALDELKEGHFHVLEPTTTTLVPPCEIDLMIVPLLAYDEQLYRIGYGKGYYDRYMSDHFHGYKIGLAFSFQKVGSFDHSCYDVPMDEIIHE